MAGRSGGRSDGLLPRRPFTAGPAAEAALMSNAELRANGSARSPCGYRPARNAVPVGMTRHREPWSIRGQAPAFLSSCEASGECWRSAMPLCASSGRPCRIAVGARQPARQPLDFAWGLMTPRGHRPRRARLRERAGRSPLLPWAQGRRRADLNRCTRLCRPLPNPSATSPRPASLKARAREGLRPRARSALRRATAP